MNYRASIVIPCYNYGEYLSEAIESALNQTVSCEIIVVNDGSTDNTLQIAQNYPVRIVNKENGGLASARNAGIKLATSDYICCLDADDKLDKHFIEETLGKNDIVGVSQVEFGDSNNIWKPPHEHPIFENFKNYNCINCSSLFRKEIWDKIGGYDENMHYQGYEDWDFWLRATKAGYNVTVIDKPLVFYRKHGHSMITDTVKKHNELYKYMIQKL